MRDRGTVYEMLAPSPRLLQLCNVCRELRVTSSELAYTGNTTEHACKSLSTQCSGEDVLLATVYSKPPHQSSSGLAKICAVHETHQDADSKWATYREHVDSGDQTAGGNVSAMRLAMALLSWHIRGKHASTDKKDDQRV